MADTMLDRLARGAEPRSEPSCATRSPVEPAPPSTLDNITERILSAARVAHEIGNQLHIHADALHGPIPETAMNEKMEDRPSGAIERICRALDTLDQAQVYAAGAARRNTTLA